MYYLDREGLTYLINRIKQWISSFNKTDTPVSGSYVTSVSESNGIISVTRESADTVPTESSTKLITSGGVESALSMDLTSVSGNPITISDASNTNCETLVATLSPTQEGTGDPSPDNVRPISGMSTLNVNRAGKNLFDYATWSSEASVERGTVVFENNGATLTAIGHDAYTTYNTNMTPIRVLPSTSYTLSWESETTIAGLVYIFDGNLSLMGGTYASSQSYTFTTPSDCTEIYFRVGVQTSGNTIHYKNIQLALGDTALTTYEAYQGTTITLNLGSTVYGGSVDLRSGVLTVDKASVVFDGSEDENWSCILSNNHYRGYTQSITDIVNEPNYSAIAKAICDKIPTGTWDNAYAGVFKLGQAGKIVGFGLDDLGITTVAGLQTWLSNNNLHIVYELATPLTTQLPPQTLRLLQGNNTLWTNAERLEVEYQPNNFAGDIESWTTSKLDDYTPTSELPTAGNGTLTIQKNGTTIQTFSANQTSNTTANITVPTKVSELTNDSSYVTGSDITSAINALDVSSVGGSGKYIQSISETNGKISATQATMPTSLPASDVYGWAKASTKPTYTASEVGASAIGHKHDDRYYTETEMDTKLNAKLNTSLKGMASGVAELDANGLVPSSQLPSYVDDVLEYSSKSSFPSTGETGKIYVDTTTNLTWRWSGSTYVEISPSLALGTTSSTAYRGDHGNTAYTHATDSSKLTTATATGLYKVGSTANGHISKLTAVTKSDITGLGIPSQDTTYSVATTTTSGLMSATDKVKLNGIETGAEVNQPAFSRVYVGSATIEADSTTDVLTLTAGANVTLTPDTTNDKITIGATDTTYSAGTGLSLSGTTINHSNSVTSGTIGSTSATSGYSISVPYANYDAQGHITSKGTHTHTIPRPQIVFSATGSSSNLRTVTSSSYTNYNYMNSWSSVAVENTDYIDASTSAYHIYMEPGLYYVRANVTLTATGQINRMKRAKIRFQGRDQLVTDRRLELSSSTSSTSVWEDIIVDGFIQVSSILPKNQRYLEVYVQDESGSASWYVQELQIVYMG